jgi:hypothetical protein
MKKLFLLIALFNVMLSYSQTIQRVKLYDLPQFIYKDRSTAVEYIKETEVYKFYDYRMYEYGSREPEFIIKVEDYNKIVPLLKKILTSPKLPENERYRINDDNWVITIDRIDIIEIDIIDHKTNFKWITASWEKKIYNEDGKLIKKVPYCKDSPNVILNTISNLPDKLQ